MARSSAVKSLGCGPGFPLLHFLSHKEHLGGFPASLHAI